jgi:hypothetical protein
MERAFTEDDEATVIGDAMDLYRQGDISKSDLNKVISMARSKKKTDSATPWAKEVRKGLGVQLLPKDKSEPRQFTRRMEGLFAFDDWMAANPKATREEALAKGNEIVKLYGIRDLKKIRDEIPMPYAPVLPRYRMNMDGIKQSAAKLKKAFDEGKLSKEQFNAYVGVIRKWVDLINEEEKASAE